MRALTNVLLASASALGMSACLPDFSPDPQKSDQAKAVDGAVINEDAAAATDGGARDANSGGSTGDANTPSTEAGGPIDQPDSGGGTGTGAPPPAGCDLRGKWFVNEHWITEVIGAEQQASNMFYFEIEQDGTNLLVKTSYGCGATLQGLGFAVARTDDSASWPAYAVQPNYGGRKGTVTAAGNGCQVNFDRATVVHGATVAYYSDETKDLPTVMEKAGAGGQPPGWEDWDNDNNPGVTLVLSGLASGQLYIASRAITQYDGTVPLNSTTIKLHMDWEQTRSTLGANPNSDILTAPANRVMDESRQFVQMAKVTDAQAGTGTPAEICTNLRNMAMTLTPDAYTAL